MCIYTEGPAGPVAANAGAAAVGRDPEEDREQDTARVNSALRSHLTLGLICEQSVEGPADVVGVTVLTTAEALFFRSHAAHPACVPKPPACVEEASDLGP